MSVGPRRRGIAAAAILVVYALILAATPLLHHDLDCHFKTPTHCQACLASPAAAPTAISVVGWSGPLPEAGRAFAAPRLLSPLTVRVEISGRAPPA